MLRWIRNALRRWLLTEEELQDILKLIDGREVRVVGVNGRSLVSLEDSPDGGESHTLIMERSALSREHFWKLHKKYSGGASVTWASDGKPYLS